MYFPNYADSYALIIGINTYEVAPPLRFAVSDALGVADSFKELGFAEDKMCVLTDENATRDFIDKSFMDFTRKCGPNDRLVVFFAGHGYTVRSFRGEVGFLVPHDGDPRDLSSLIRWDDLTRNADLIEAKHILFLMDACYGGLAVTRSITPGSVRFLKDMLKRVSRQVLTAGKADEPVGDAGGPLPDHSVFTGHLIEALRGKAKDNSGSLTANGIISYVYQAVSRDETSQQTPHYGYVHGDGDMIFEPRGFPNDEPDEPVDNEQLVAIPIDSGNEMAGPSRNEELKELLSEDKYRIKLFDFVVHTTRKVLAATAEDYFPVDGPVTNEILLERLTKYQSALQEIIPHQMLLARWSKDGQRETLALPIQRMAERLRMSSGSTWLLASRWYPMLLLLYSCGIGAVVGNNYVSLFEVMHTQVPTQNARTEANLLVAAFDGTGEIYDGFKLIPGQGKSRSPRSEHILSVLQPFADDVLFVGSAFEAIFDRVELLASLEYGHLTYNEESLRYWSPIGRFGWRGKHYGPTPLKILQDEADRMGANWYPLRAGFFGGSMSRFQVLAEKLSTLISQISWY